MKKNYSLFSIAFVLLFFMFSCKQSTIDKQVKTQEVNFESSKKESIKRHKKGIEEIADYQKEIRKPVDALASTYKNGYLVTEYNKANKTALAKKGANAISPIFIERGPANVPGRTRGVAIDPTNSNRWFVGTVGGGVWLTENAGSTWRSLTDFQISNLATSTIVISPANPNTIYVGTGEPFGNLGSIGGSGMYKSTDGGASWQHLTATINYGDIGRIIINPADEDTVLMGTTSGIYRTTDGGVSWARTYSLSGNVQDLDADPTDFNIQYGSIQNKGIVKSEDGGITWTLVFDRANFNNSHRRFETTVSPADPNTIFLSVYTGGTGATVGVNSDFYVSRDKGVTYTNLGTTGSASAANLISPQGWYDNVIMGHPYDSNVFYVGGVAVFKVTISGTNFTSKSIASGYSSSQINRNVHVDQHGLYTILGNSQEFKILLANDGGIFTSNTAVDPGVVQGNWSNAVTGKNSAQFYGASKENGKDNYLVGAQDNGSWKSSGDNASKTKVFAKRYGGDGFETVWHYTKPGNYLVTSQNGVIGRYINSVRSTSNTPDSGISSKSPFYSKISNADNNPDVVFTISSNGVWRSTDFAGKWNLTPIASKFATRGRSSLNVKVSPANPNIVWAGAEMTESGSYTMHVSTDNGQSFTPTNVFDSPVGTHNYYISGMATSYTEKNRAYLAFSGQGAAKILKTEDLGTTWTDISGFTTGINTGFPDVAVHCVLEMPFNKDIIWAGTDIGIFQTENGGATWNIITDFLSVATYDMKVVNDQVVIATYGRGVWSATIAELNTYTLPTYLIAPDVTVTQKEFLSSKGIIAYNVTDDEVNRVKIFVDGVEKGEVTQDFNTGVTYNFETENLLEGVHKVGVQLFKDTNNTETIIREQEFSIIEFKTPNPELKITEFTPSDVYIYNAGFNLSNLDNQVTGVVLNNSEHPYKNATTYAVLLKQPLIISPSNKNFTYEDFALVEPYTTNLNDFTQFYDYVIIEASTDFKTWQTIDKYDARRFPEWMAEFGKPVNSMNINDALFKEQTVDLTTKGFVEGDTVIFRFSLVTDPGATSYGWAIRSINNTPTASIQEVLANKKVFTVYPTISDGNFTVFAKSTAGKSKVSIIDVRGRQVYSSKLDFSKKEKQAVSLNSGSGIYIINVEDENGKKASKKIVIQ